MISVIDMPEVRSTKCCWDLEGQRRSKRRDKILPKCLKFQTLGLIFPILSRPWGEQFLRFNRKMWLIILSIAGRPQVIHNILKPASPMYTKRSCCLCHAAQNCVWFSFWLLHFPLATHLIWCALSLPDLITSFLELACCLNWVRGENTIKWVSNSIPAITLCSCPGFLDVFIKA